ncbi:hypothetical protein [Bartonella sp. AU55XJBT]|nr:hypothetical protein [Bartonella sp. AU55XJBT]
MRRWEGVALEGVALEGEGRIYSAWDGLRVLCKLEIDLKGFVSV